MLLTGVGPRQNTWTDTYMSTFGMALRWDSFRVFPPPILSRERGFARRDGVEDGPQGLAPDPQRRVDGEVQATPRPR